MQHTTDATRTSPAMTQAFGLLSQLGLREPVLFGEDVDASSGTRRRLHINAVAAFPAGHEPVASKWLQLTQKLHASLRPGAKRAPGTIAPREFMLYENGSFGVTVGMTHLHVRLAEKPVSVAEVLAAQPASQQVALHQEQGSIARAETAARQKLRFQAELA